MQNTPEAAGKLEVLFKQGTDCYSKQDWGNAIKARVHLATAWPASGCHH